MHYERELSTSYIWCYIIGSILFTEVLLLKRIISVNSICSLQQIATSTRYSEYIQQML